MEVKSSRIRVGVIFGGRSGEHEISLLSARSVMDALDPQKYQIVQIGVTHEGAWLVGENVWQALADQTLERLLPATLLPEPGRGGLYIIRTGVDGDVLQLYQELDVFFPVLHGTFGEDGTVQGLLEMSDIAYVGAGVLGSALGMDKAVFRKVMLAIGVPVLETMVVLRKQIQAHLDGVLDEAERLAPYPLFVKPANLGSSVGISKCKSRSDLVEGLLEAARYDCKVLVQRGISAREIEVSVLGNDEPEASMPGEIIPSREFYSYEAKYIDNRSELIIPAPMPEEMAERVRQLAIQAYRAVDCCGLARVDFLLDRDTNELYLSELNTMPGFTNISMYPKLWEASGLSYPALVDRLVELALERKAERDRTEWRYTPG